MKRLLCIVTGMNAGGAETFLMKIYRILDKTEYQMDFCVGVTKECFYDKEIKRLGGKIYHISQKTKNPFKSFNDIRKIVKRGKYSSVLRVSHHSMSSIDLIAAKIGGAEKVAFRSSNSNSCGSLINRFMHVIFKPFAICVPNIKIAPSDVAAIHMFGKSQYKNNKVLILNNGLKIEDYKYDEIIRKRKRKELGIKDNEFVIGHVGRMAKQKNHKYLIEVFEKYLSINNNCKLILIGDGELRDEIKKQISDKKIDKNVLILGIRADTNELYQAMDCFLFPSLYEGMPNSVIEAQTSGLKCVVSDSITREVKLTNNISFCSISDINKWVKSISKNDDRRFAYKEIIEKNYDIDDVAKKFEEIIF